MLVVRSNNVVGWMLTLLGLYLLVAISVHAERLPIKTYTTADGLAQNAVNLIVRDSRGFLWFCTDEGLSRFDGYTFTNYTAADGLPHPIVKSFLETRNGIYWVGTYSGVCRFNPKGRPRLRTDPDNQTNDGQRTTNDR